MFYVFMIILFTLEFGGLYWYLGYDLGPWFIILWVVLGLITSVILNIALALLFFVFASKNPPKRKLKHFVLRNACQFGCYIMNIKLVVKGIENKPKGSYVIYGNHKSNMDPVFIYLALHDMISAVGKKSLFTNPIMRMLFKTFAALPLDRENDREALKTMILAIKQVKEGLPMIIFPEGGIKSRETEEMVDLKPGAYKLAVKSASPILPITIKNSSKMYHKPFYKRIKIEVIIHPAISFDEYKDLTTNEIGQRVESIINGGLYQ